MEDAIERDGLRAPCVGDLAETLELNPVDVAATLRRFEDLGFLAAVSKNRFLTMRQLARLAGIAEQLSKSGDDDATGFTASVFKNASGVGRNITIEVLEYFDRIGLTRRQGMHRRLLRSSREVFGRR